jgi:hypothetical protein
VPDDEVDLIAHNGCVKFFVIKDLGGARRHGDLDLIALDDLIVGGGESVTETTSPVS